MSATNAIDSSNSSVLAQISQDQTVSDQTATLNDQYQIMADYLSTVQNSAEFLATQNDATLNVQVESQVTQQ